MTIYKPLSVTLLSKLFALAAMAQEAAPFRDFVNSLPQPPASFQQAMLKQPVTSETLLAPAGKTITMSRGEAYRPLYAYFLKNFSDGQSKATAFSAAEQKLYSDYAIGSKGLSADLQYLQFQLTIENRPFFGSGQISWGLPGKFSGDEKEFYLQALALEKLFDNSYLKPSPEKLVQEIFSSDPVLDAINKTLNKELAALPMRKVRTAEGFIIEVQDPVKAIAAYETYGRQRQDHFAKAYGAGFATWQQQYKRLLAIAEKLDALTAHASAKMPAAAVLLSDLQGRMWDVSTHVFTATDKLWQDIFIAQMGQKQVQEAIDTYATYKSNTQ